MYAMAKMVYLTMPEPYAVPKVVEHVAEQAVLRETVERRTAAQDGFQKRTRNVKTCPWPHVYSKTHMSMLKNHINLF